MKKRRLLLYICIFLGSCTTAQKNTVSIATLNREYDMESQLDEQLNASLYQRKYHLNEKGELICEALKFPDQTWFRLNLTQNAIMDSIDYKIFDFQSLHNFFHVSPDVTLLSFNATYMNGYYDKAWLFVDRNKNIIDSVSFTGAPVKLQHHQNSNFNNSMRYWIRCFDFPLTYINNQIFVPLIKWEGDKSCIPQDSLIGIISHNPHKPFKRLPIHFQCPPEGYYWSSEYREPHGTTDLEYLYTFFGSEPVLYRYTIKNEKLNSARMPFAAIDTILPYPVGVEAKQYDGYKSQYLDLFYNPDKKQLIWTARVACDSSDSPACAQNRNFIYSFAIIDRNLKKIAEGIVPEGYEAVFIPYKDGFLLPKLNCAKMTFGYFTYSITKGDSLLLRKQIRERRDKLNKGYEKLPENQMLAKYMREVIGKKASQYRGAMLIPESTCPACQPAYAHIISKYQDQLLEKGIAVILIYDRKKRLDEFMEIMEEAARQNVTWRTSEALLPLYQDTTQIYFPYFPAWVNMRYIEFDDFGKLKYDKIINPGDIAEFEKRIAE